MKSPRSIRVRLLILALAGTLLAIATAGAGLVALFDRYAERRAAQELSSYMTQLAGSISVVDRGKLLVTGGPPNPRFTIYGSGLYWQVLDANSHEIVRSASLGQSDLKLPDTMALGVPATVYYADLPGNRTGIGYARFVALANGDAERPLRLAIAMDRSDMDELRAGFAADMIPGLLLLGALFVAGAWVQVRLGVKPLNEVQSQINEVRSGQKARLSANVPIEVAPLVHEVNTLLDAQAAQIERIRNRTADLAHGIKTPLTALSTDVQRLKDCGQTKLACDIEALMHQMRQTVERELARSRFRHPGLVRYATNVTEVLDGLVRTLARTPAGEGISPELILPDGFSVSMARDDLADVLDNLLENAFRAARSRVRLRGTDDGEGKSIVIEDDGEGLDPAELEKLASRGVQTSSSPGSAGIGLSIVAEIMALYDVGMQFSHSSMGGLSVTLRLR